MAVKPTHGLSAGPPQGKRLAPSGGGERSELRGRAWRGRAVAVLALAAAVGLGLATLNVLDRRPRTHDAHLFAYSAGMAPEVSGRIVALRVTNNQRVTKGQPLVDIDSEPFDLRLRQARAPDGSLRAP